MTEQGLPLADEDIAQMSDEQRAILHELAGYAAQELNLSKIIKDTTDQVRRAMKEAGFTRTEQPAALHEDPEVDILMSAKSRHKIANVQDRIRRTLERAAGLGLGKYRLIRQQCANYGVPLDG
jgi:hypothetical protein